jgi:hypothetical protein
MIVLHWGGRVADRLDSGDVEVYAHVSSGAASAVTVLSVYMTAEFSRLNELNYV